jgi:hypothetical protein
VKKMSMSADKLGIIDIAGDEYHYEHLVLGHYFVLNAKTGSELHKTYPFPIPNEKKFTLAGYKVQANGESLDHSDNYENRFWINVSKKNDLDGKHRFGGEIGHALFPFSAETESANYPSDRQITISALAPPMDTLEIEFQVKAGSSASANVRVRVEVSLLLLTKVEST